MYHRLGSQHLALGNISAYQVCGACTHSCNAQHGTLTSKIVQQEVKATVHGMVAYAVLLSGLLPGQARPGPIIESTHGIGSLDSQHYTSFSSKYGCILYGRQAPDYHLAGFCDLVWRVQAANSMTSTLDIACL